MSSINFLAGYVNASFTLLPVLAEVSKYKAPKLLAHSCATSLRTALRSSRSALFPTTTIRIIYEALARISSSHRCKLSKDWELEISKTSNATMELSMILCTFYSMSGWWTWSSLGQRYPRPSAWPPSCRRWRSLIRILRRGSIRSSRWICCQVVARGGSSCPRLRWGRSTGIAHDDVLEQQVVIIDHLYYIQMR